MFRRNVPASRFFSKRGSRCPISQSQGANTPSVWLFGSWSNVETQSIPQFAKKNFISRSVYGSWSAVCQNLPLVQWICTGLKICKRRFNSLYRAAEVLCTFCHLALPPTEVFCTFCHLALIGIQSCPFFSHAETSLKEKKSQTFPSSTSTSSSDFCCNNSCSFSCRSWKSVMDAPSEPQKQHFNISASGWTNKSVTGKADDNG